MQCEIHCKVQGISRTSPGVAAPVGVFLDCCRNTTQNAPFFSLLGLLSRACRHKLQQAGSSKPLGRAGDPLPEETLGTRGSLVLANTQMHPPALRGYGRVPSVSVSPVSFLLPGFPSLGGGDQGAQMENRGRLCALSKKKKKKQPTAAPTGFCLFFPSSCSLSTFPSPCQLLDAKIQAGHIPNDPSPFHHYQQKKQMGVFSCDVELVKS